MSGASSVTVNVPLFVNVVVRDTPFTRTSDLDTKPAPVTVNVGAGVVPAYRIAGEIDVRLGIGFERGAHARMALLTLRRPPVVVTPAIAGIGSTAVSSADFKPAVVSEHAESNS